MDGMDESISTCFDPTRKFYPTDVCYVFPLSCTKTDQK
jgi:hypothetical protein